jgi:hypothetical protein
MKKSFLLFLLPLFWISGCSNEQETVDSELSNKGLIFEKQTEALEKAKQVEKILQQGADRNRQIIEEQSK